jgi:N-acetylmuramoyl-L-alanine amidase
MLCKLDSMRNFLVLLFLLLGLALLDQATVSASGAVRFNGQDYVPIADWARSEHLDGHWLKSGDTYEAANRTTRLVFEVNSDYVQVNGTYVAFSFPVADQKGTALVAQFDIDHTILPLLHPSRYVKSDPIKTICLDPGHGGRDTGNIFQGHDEKTYTLLLAFDLRDELEKDGFKVILTRTRDKYVSLSDRPAFAYKHHADLFVSLHFNATRVDRAHVEGPESYCITPAGARSTNAHDEGSNLGATLGNRNENNSLWLAYEVEKSLVQRLHLVDRGVRRARFEVLRDARMPAILVESGYMTNPEEGKKIYTPAYRHELAREIAKGILAYQKLTE